MRQFANNPWGLERLNVDQAVLAFSEIDKFGFGKYQRCIWLLCGFGYFLDLAWAQGVGLIATAIL